MGSQMNLLTSAHSLSLDGFIADADHRSDRLQAWLQAGDTPSRLNPTFKMAPQSARFFDEGVGRCGAVISGRRTYDVSNAWGGNGPMGPLPLFVVTHQPPDHVPEGPLRYTFVTDGIESAVEQARLAAADQDVVLMGASMVQQCLRAGLLDEIIISLVPIMLGDGVSLFGGGNAGGSELVINSVIAAPGVTHLTYRVVR
jgi:dihydrofolate reductase